MVPGEAILLFSMASVMTLSSIASYQCPEEYSQVDAVNGNIPLPKWPQTSAQSRVLSEPLCLSEDFHVIARECADSWSPEIAPICSHILQKYSSFYCPPGYQVVNSDNDYMCVTLSQEPWSNTCQFNSKAFDDEKDLVHALIEHLRNRGVFTAWLPIKRFRTFGPLLWQTPGPNWGSQVKIPGKIDYIYDYENKRCFVLDISQGVKIKAEACIARHPYLCIVGENHFPRGACPSKYVASPIPDDKRCFQLVKKSGTITWRDAKRKCTTAQINSHPISYLFSGMAREADLSDRKFCWIGGDGRYTSNTMAMSSEGVITNFNTTMKLSCVFCEMDTPSYPNTRIGLKFHAQDRLLLLTVYDENGLFKVSRSDPGIRCFTNAAGDFIRTVELEKYWEKRWTAEDIEPDLQFEDRVALDFDTQKTIYRVEISDSGPGYYICEGHTISGELLSTKYTFAYEEEKGHAFALVVEITKACVDNKYCDPTLSPMYRELAEYYELITPDDLINDIRPMEIMDITPDGNVTILFHVTAEDFDDSNMDPASIPTAHEKIQQVFQAIAVQFPNTYKFKYIRSCYGCLSTITGRGTEQLHWPLTPVGVTAVPQKICLDSNGLPVYRRCEGSYTRGGVWAEPSGQCVTNCSSTTRKLYEVTKGLECPDGIFNRTAALITSTIVEQAQNLTSMDIFYLSKIMQYEANSYNNTDVHLEDLHRISSIMDKVMTTDRKILEQAQILNSSNVLLDSLSTMLSTAANNVNQELLSGNEGLISITTSQLIIQISDPNITDFTGLALLRKSTNMTKSNSFSDYTVVPLTVDQAIEDVALIGNIEVATWFPRNLLDCMSASNSTTCNGTTAFNNSLSNTIVNGSPRIIITVFYSDIVFNSINVDRTFIDSRVISVSVPGSAPHLPIPIPLLFKPMKGTEIQSEMCAFWDFDYLEISPEASHSAWSPEGCENAGRTRDSFGELNICLCSHLTHFAQLVLGHFPEPEHGGDPLSLTHGEVLEVITIVGCVLSMIGIFGILITASIFKSWRRKPGTKVLIQLSIALGLEKFVVGIVPLVDSTDYPIPCIISGVVLHYSILTEFTWMLVTARLQFKRYVMVLGVTRPPRFLLKAALFAWGLPCIIVLIIVAINPDAYLPASDSVIRFCQVSGVAQYIGLLLPVAIVVILNIILFGCVICSIAKTTNNAPHIQNDMALVLAQVRLGVMLFFLLGINWIFGLIARMGGGLIFSYLFCVTAALQGFVLFLFFIVCDPATRKLWNSIVGLSGKLSAQKGLPSSSASSAISESVEKF